MLADILNIETYLQISRFDEIWTDPHPYKNITSITLEKCPGLDA